MQIEEPFSILPLESICDTLCANVKEAQAKFSSGERVRFAWEAAFLAANGQEGPGAAAPAPSPSASASKKVAEEVHHAAGGATEVGSALASQSSIACRVCEERVSFPLSLPPTPGLSVATRNGADQRQWGAHRKRQQR